MADKTPISEVIENFARDIIEAASKADVKLPQKLDAFARVTAYFVGIHKVGANTPPPKVEKDNFGDMKKDLQEFK